MKNNTMLLIIDVQQAFINKFTQHIPNLIEHYLENNNDYSIVLLSRFINYPNSNWVKYLNYRKCMNDKDTNIILKIKNSYRILNKSSYTAYNEEL